MSTTKQLIGSVSHGTMREEDLIPTFLDTLDGLDKAQADAIREEHADMLSRLDTDEQTEADEDDAYNLLNETLFDALSSYAPPYCYFGAHPGDGSDYGFWPVEDLAQSVKDNGGMVVSDLSELDDTTASEVLLVNDHGNCTLYVAKDGKLTEIWSIV